MVKLNSLSLKCKALAAVLLLSGWLPVTYTRSEASIVESASMIAGIESLKSLTSGIIDDATQSGDYLLFRLGTEILNSINAWEQANTNLLDKTFGELDLKQQTFFTKTERILTKLKDDVERNIDTIEDMSNQFQTTLAGGIIFEDFPLISSYGPMVITPLSEGRTLRVNIKGSSFKWGDPKLQIDNKGAKLVGRSPTALTFELNDFSTNFDENETRILPASLTVYKPDDNAFVRLLGSIEPVIFQIPLMVAPTSLGSWTVSYSYKVTEERSQNKKKNMAYSSGSISHKCERNNVGVSQNNRQIRKLKCRATEGHNGKWDILSQNATGFSVDVCAARQNRPPFYPPGDQHVQCTYQEYWKEAKVKSGTKNGTFEWGNEISVTLPDNTTTVGVTIKTFDGRTLQFSETGKRSFFDIETNANRTKTIIRQEASMLTNL